MKQIIFVNNKTLSIKDILLILLLGIGITLLVKVLSPIRFHGHDMTWMETLVLGCVLISIWTIKSINAKTLKRVEIENDMIYLTFQRQFGNDFTIELDKTTISFEIYTKPDRLIPRNRILKIIYGEKELKISSRYKGLSENILNDIAKKIMHSPQQQV